LPFPSWPVWLVFALLLVPSLAMLGLLGLTKDGAEARVAVQRDAVDRNLVLTGILSDVDTSSGMPNTTSYYDVVVPDPKTGEKETVTFSGETQWGFPPSSDYPARIDFLVVLDDRPRAVDHGPVGTVDPVTHETLQDAEGELAGATAVWVTGIVVFWMFTLGLPVLATVLAVRRHRAKKRRAAPFVL
jgi:hypothetical protein